MRPVLLSVFGIDVQTYGVSKALAAWVAALLLGRAFERRGIGSCIRTICANTRCYTLPAAVTFPARSGHPQSLHDQQSTVMPQIQSGEIQ